MAAANENPDANYILCEMKTDFKQNVSCSWLALTCTGDLVLKDSVECDILIKYVQFLLPKGETSETWQGSVQIQKGTTRSNHIGITSVFDTQSEERLSAQQNSRAAISIRTYNKVHDLEVLRTVEAIRYKNF